MHDIDPRLLRQFVAVAHELHFGRAAAGLFIAQQALSRNIARLEEQLGVTLFIRSTRRVELTSDGARLLPLATELLAVQGRIHDELGRHRALLVDVMHDRSTPARVLDLARTLAPDAAFEARFHGGFAAALRALLDRRVEVAFGRLHGTGLRLPSNLPRRLVRYEPLGLLMLPDAPLAHRDAIPMRLLEGVVVDTSGGNPDAPEWEDLADRLVEEHRGVVAPPHHPGMAALAAGGPEETARHLRTTGWPILTMTDVVPVPGTVIRRLVDPVPVYPWTRITQHSLRHPGLEAIERAIDQLVATEGWLDLPPNAWLAPADRARS